MRNLPMETNNLYPQGMSEELKEAIEKDDGMIVHSEGSVDCD